MKILPGQYKKRSIEVDVVDKELMKEAREMVELCQLPLGKKPGALALAHCQVDHTNPKRFFVTFDGKVVINPTILSKKNSFTHTEGCMSYAFRGDKKIKRYNDLEVEYTTGRGDRKKEVVSGLMACIFQHEIDHMNGISVYS